jgi:hypothetical protein
MKASTATTERRQNSVELSHSRAEAVRWRSTSHALGRRTWTRICDVQADGLLARSLNALFQGRLPLSRLHAPVSFAVLAVSSRTLMNSAG